jgi:dipeptidase E
MKLYLSSYRIPDPQVLTDLLGKSPRQTKVALIPNAKDYYAPRARAFKARQIQAALRAYGFNSTVVDLNDFPGAGELKETLLRYDMLWCMGGNTFCLREAMAKSGFDAVIHEVIAAGVVYAGESAGTCVAGTDLRGIEHADEVEFAEKTIWKGLKLSDHYFLPHADNEEFLSAAEAILKQRGADPRLVALNDTQAWIRNGNEEWKITATKSTNT